MKIKNISDIILFESKYDNIKEAVIDAVNSGANLSGADLSGANLENISISFQLVPEIGSFIGWKKAKGMILMLKIPKSAERTSNLKNRKCRCSYIKTLQIQNIDGSVSEIKSVLGDHDNHTIYEIGKTTKADFFDSDIRKDCTNGIHFFITRKEAVDY